MSKGQKITLFGILLTGIVSLVVARMMTTQSQEQLAQSQMTQIAVPAWQPVTIDLAKAGEYGLIVTNNDWSDPYNSYHLDPENYTIFLYKTMDFSGNTCLVSVFPPQDPDSLWAKQGVTEFNLEYDHDTFLKILRFAGGSHSAAFYGSWKLEGSEANVLDFMQYSESEIAHNPACNMWLVEDGKRLSFYYPDLEKIDPY